MDDRILETLRTCVVAVVPEVPAADVTGDRTLAALGCDSIDRADILVMTMSRLGVVVPPSEFRRDLGIDDIVALLRAHR